jgi:TorA maturation chaperone TorD
MHKGEKMKASEDTITTLESRALNHLFFQIIFGNEPTKQLLDIVCSDAIADAFKVFAVDEDSNYTASLRSAIGTFGTWKVDVGVSVEKLRSEYTRLFLGPDDLDAPPWESMYTGEHRSLFQEHTLEVRNIYRTQGFLPTEYPRVADDHIALEFAFMTQLAERAKKACAEGDTPMMVKALEASRQFLEEHMLAWIPEYAIRLSEARGAKDYPVIAALASGFLTVDKMALEKLLSETTCC